MTNKDRENLAVGNIYYVQSSYNVTSCFKVQVVEIIDDKLAGHLMQRGFVLIGMQPDLKHTGRNVFFFKNTHRLKNAVDEYMSR